MDNLYLDNLDEYVNDENRIVTYKWLSYTLSVHVNQAKRMLLEFVQKQRADKAKNKLCVTYFVSGVTREADHEVQNFQVVPEMCVDALKSKLNPITSCHVYSVSKTTIKDQASLCQADYDITKENLSNSNMYSAIICEEAVVRSDADLARLREAAQPTTEAPSFTKPKTGSTSSKKLTGIAGMFAAGANKKTTETNDSHKKSENTTVSESKKPHAKGKGGGIANFFSNQASKPKKQITNENTDDNNTSGVKKVFYKSTPAAKGKKKARDDSDEDEIQHKKRRRVKAAVWSSSSEDEPEEEPVPEPAREPSPPPTPSPPPRAPTPEKIQTSPENVKQKTVSQKSPANGAKRRKRQKKMVSKSFIDEEGFMVTEKVWQSESESCSDEDIIPPTPPVSKTTKPRTNTTDSHTKVKKSPAKKKTEPVKKGTKQASLMSFFKKK